MRLSALIAMVVSVVSVSILRVRYAGPMTLW